MKFILAIVLIMIATTGFAEEKTPELYKKKCLENIEGFNKNSKESSEYLIWLATTPNALQDENLSTNYHFLERHYLTNIGIYCNEYVKATRKEK